MAGPCPEHAACVRAPRHYGRGCQSQVSQSVMGSLSQDRLAERKALLLQTVQR